MTYLEFMNLQPGDWIITKELRQIVQVDYVKSENYKEGILICESREINYKFCDLYIMSEELEEGVQSNRRMKNLTTQEEYFQKFQETLDSMLELTTKKNQDYANSKNAFHNFSQIEILTKGRVSTADGILTRLSDKMSRLANLGLGKGKSNENITDTILDLAIYSIILKIFIELYPDGFLYEHHSKNL